MKKKNTEAPPIKAVDKAVNTIPKTPIIINAALIKIVVMVFNKFLNGPYILYYINDFNG